MTSVKNKSVSCRLGAHMFQAVIFIQFPHDKDLIEDIKKQPAVRWSRSQKAWYIPDTATSKEKFGISAPHEKSEEAVLTGICKTNQSAMSALVSALQLKAYSPHTIRTYCNEFAQLLRYMGDTSVNALSHATKPRPKKKVLLPSYTHVSKICCRTFCIVGTNNTKSTTKVSYI